MGVLDLKEADAAVVLVAAAVDEVEQRGLAVAGAGADEVAPPLLEAHGGL